MKLSDFASKSSMNFFKILNLDTSFLDIDPQHWNKHEGYQKASEEVRAMSSTNDLAERAIQLCSKVYSEKKSTESDQFNKICVNTHFYNQNKLC